MCFWSLTLIILSGDAPNYITMIYLPYQNFITDKNKEREKTNRNGNRGEKAGHKTDKERHTKRNRKTK